MYVAGNNEKDCFIRTTSILARSHGIKLVVPLLALAFAQLAEISPARAQGIVLDPEETMAPLTEALPDSALFMVNGPATTLANASGETFVPLGSFQKPLLALLTLRLADEGVVALDAPLNRYVPDVIDGGPFKAPINLRHLLQETGGFASPPLSLEPLPLAESLDHSALRRFAISLRSAGQVSRHDPVGWAVVIAALEAATGNTIKALLTDHIFAPMALDANSLTLGHQRLSADRLPLVIEMEASAYTVLAGLLIRNRDAAGDLFLDYGTYQDLIQGLQGHRMHPYGDVSSYGITIRRRGPHSWLEPLHPRCKTPGHLMAFPREGTVIGAAAGDTALCLPNLVRAGSLAVARKHFPGRPAPERDGPSLVRPSKLEGRYVPADRSPAALNERLDLLQSDWLSVFGYTGEQLRTRRRDGPVAFYQQTEAYQFTREESGAAQLTFSPFKLGGYVLIGDQLFRRADILGAAGQLRRMMPWALIAVLTAGYYALGRRPKPWRRMGQFALIGGTLVAVGLYLEANHWAATLYDAGQPWLITLWRLGLNVGLMLVLSLPMFVLSFARKKAIPTHGTALLTAPHLVLVAVSALAIFFTLVLWGVAGTFAPY